MTDRLVGVREAAQFLDVPVSTLYQRWQPWGLRGYRVGRALKFRTSELDAWLSRQAT